FPMTICLMVITAVTLIYAGATVEQPPIVAASGHPEVVRKFYDAVNDDLRQGDSSTLMRITSTSFAVYRTGVDTTEDRDEFLKHISDLRVTYPELSIALEDVMADGDRVVARITFHGIEGAAQFGIPSAESAPRELSEIFRTEHGQVQEYRGLVADFDAPREVLHETVTAGWIHEAEVGVARLNLRPEAQMPALVAVGPTIYVVESGAVTFHVQGQAWRTLAAVDGVRPTTEATRPGAVGPLGPGDQLAIDTAIPYSLSATNLEQAIVLVATLMPSDLAAPPSSHDASVAPIIRRSVLMFLADTTQYRLAIWPAGVSSQPLLRPTSVIPPDSSISLGLRRLTLAPGMTTTGALPPGSAQMIVASGIALLRQDAARSPNGIPATPTRAASGMSVIAAGQSAILNMGTTTLLRNIGDEPLVVLILTLSPNDGPSTLTVPLPSAS
ncbi:MAG TPA: nuclear transport factor 2 family protein, partial [Thermomicrobiales bacterium]|nr:nuclear transport factor 2 family protein [Thermomicrobiales bacterium]